MYFPDLIRDFQQQELTEVNYHFKRLYGVNLPSFFIPTIQEEFNLTLEKAVEFHQSKVEPSNEDLGDYIEKIRNISTIKVPQVSQSGIPLPNNESVTNAGHLVHKARLFFI